jgi:hypothetical protein
VGKQQGQQERPFLGDALNRLVRMLGVSGSASPEYDDGSKIVPTVIVGDGTFPGYGAEKLRRFKIGFLSTNNAGFPVHVGFTAQRDCIIQRITLSWTVANTGISIRYFGPNDALPFAIANSAGCFVDRALSSGEVAPLLVGDDITGAAVNGARIWQYEMQAAQLGNLQEALTEPWLLMGGATFIVRTQTNNVRLNVNVEGMSL